ncbi:OB-fold tRNA/helicase-type nucleic acid binding protein, partial [Streptomyces sp. SID6648]|nr:OB-fold tRNA/helicase-type nucleic acid binding protein [Streptomyces sp. SID6648]
MSAAPRSDKPVGRFRRMFDRLSSSQEDLESEELREDADTAGCTRIGDCQDRQVVSVTGTLRTVTLRPRAGVP